MVSTVEEVSIIISRYKHAEYICQKRQDFTLRTEFKELLVKLYKHILKSQVSAACYYRRKTVSRFLRANLKLDDISEILAEIRRTDAACIALGNVFDTEDEFLSHSQLLTLLVANKETLDSMEQEVRHAVSLRPKVNHIPIHVPFAFNPGPKFTGRVNLIELLDAGFQTFPRRALRMGWGWQVAICR